MGNAQIEKKVKNKLFVYKNEKLCYNLGEGKE